jgi:hypothetical protein
MVAKLLEVARVVPQRVRAEIALVLEVLEELVEVVVEHFS